jgi:hypothetical protein
VTRMKNLAGLTVSAWLSACALGGTGGDLPDRSAAVVDGQLYDIGRLTDSTWTAITQAGAGTPTAGAAHRIAVLQAIERASGCKVTDSDYSLEGRQLNAQVDCTSRLKN